MATFVLVHGGYHGGWCWKKVVPLLRAGGHEVYTPTLTGLGERAHLLNREVGLDTHVQDIVNVLAFEDVADVVLVGHSYGGMVITGVAEGVPERIGHLVYLDASVPTGEDRAMRACFVRNEPEQWRGMEARIAGAGEGWLLPLPPIAAPFMGVTDEDDLRWLRAHLRPHPAKTLLDCLPGDHAPARPLPHSFIHCPATPGAPNNYSPDAERIRQMGGRVYEVAGGHEAIVTMPRELADVLLGVAASQ
jgi:pimeloyl-ACP methyl ester carboxylesterase